MAADDLNVKVKFIVDSSSFEDINRFIASNKIKIPVVAGGTSKSSGRDIVSTTSERLPPRVTRQQSRERYTEDPRVQKELDKAKRLQGYIQQQLPGIISWKRVTAVSEAIGRAIEDGEKKRSRESVRGQKEQLAIYKSQFGYDKKDKFVPDKQTQSLFKFMENPVGPQRYKATPWGNDEGIKIMGESITNLTDEMIDDAIGVRNAFSSLNRATKGQAENLGFLDKVTKEYRKSITGVLIDLHMLRVIGQQSKVVSAIFEILAKSLGFVVDMALLPALPIIIKLGIITREVGIWLTKLPDPTKKLFALFLLGVGGFVLMMNTLVVVTTSLWKTVIALAAFRAGLAGKTFGGGGGETAYKVGSKIKDVLPKTGSIVPWLGSLVNPLLIIVIPAVLAYLASYLTGKLAQDIANSLPPKQKRQLESVLDTSSFMGPAGEAITSARGLSTNPWAMTARFIGDVTGWEEMREIGYKKYASGGPLSPGQTAIVGERGPELLVPSGSGFNVIPNNGLRFLAEGTDGGGLGSLLESIGSLGSWLASPIENVMSSVGEFVGSVFSRAIGGSGVETGVGTTVRDSEKAILSKGFATQNTISYSGFKNANTLLAAILAALMQGLKGAGGETPEVTPEPVDASSIWELIGIPIPKLASDIWNLVTKVVDVLSTKLWNLVLSPVTYVSSQLWKLVEPVAKIIPFPWTLGSLAETTVKWPWALQEPGTVTVKFPWTLAIPIVETIAFPWKLGSPTTTEVSFPWRLQEPTPDPILSTSLWILQKVLETVNSNSLWSLVLSPQSFLSSQIWSLTLPTTKEVISALDLATVEAPAAPKTFQASDLWQLLVIPQQFLSDQIWKLVIPPSPKEYSSDTLWSLLPAAVKEYQSSDLWKVILNPQTYSSKQLWDVVLPAEIKYFTLWDAIQMQPTTPKTITSSDIYTVQLSTPMPITTDMIVDLRHIDPDEIADDWLDAFKNNKPQFNLAGAADTDPIIIIEKKSFWGDAMEIPVPYAVSSDVLFPLTPVPKTSEDLYPVTNVVKTTDDLITVTPVTKTSDLLYTIASVVVAATALFSIAPVTKLASELFGITMVPKTSEELYPLASVAKLATDLFTIINVSKLASDLFTIQQVVRLSSDLFAIQQVVKMASELFSIAPITKLASELFGITMVPKTSEDLYPLSSVAKLASDLFTIINVSKLSSDLFSIQQVVRLSSDLFAIQQVVKSAAEFFVITAVSKMASELFTIIPVQKTSDQMYPVTPTPKTSDNLFPVTPVNKTADQMYPVIPVQKTGMDFFTLLKTTMVSSDIFTILAQSVGWDLFFKLIPMNKTGDDFYKLTTKEVLAATIFSIVASALPGLAFFSPSASGIGGASLFSIIASPKNGIDFFNINGSGAELHNELVSKFPGIATQFESTMKTAVGNLSAAQNPSGYPVQTLTVPASETASYVNPTSGSTATQNPSTTVSNSNPTISGSPLPASSSFRASVDGDTATVYTNVAGTPFINANGTYVQVYPTGAGNYSTSPTTTTANPTTSGEVLNTNSSYTNGVLNTTTTSNPVVTTTPAGGYNWLAYDGGKLYGMTRTPDGDDASLVQITNDQFKEQIKERANTPVYSNKSGTGNNLNAWPKSVIFPYSVSVLHNQPTRKRFTLQTERIGGIITEDMVAAYPSGSNWTLNLQQRPYMNEWVDYKLWKTVSSSDLYNLMGGTASERIPGLALGGRAISAGLAWVGERGRELMALPKGAEVMPHTPSMDLLAKKGEPTVIDNSNHFNFDGAVFQVSGKDERQMFENFMRLMERESRRVR